MSITSWRCDEPNLGGRCVVCRCRLMVEHETRNQLHHLCECGNEFDDYLIDLRNDGGGFDAT